MLILQHLEWRYCSNIGACRGTYASAHPRQACGFSPPTDEIRRRALVHALGVSPFLSNEDRLVRGLPLPTHPLPNEETVCGVCDSCEQDDLDAPPTRCMLWRSTTPPLWVCAMHNARRMLPPLRVSCVLHLHVCLVISREGELQYVSLFWLSRSYTLVRSTPSRHSLQLALGGPLLLK